MRLASPKTLMTWGASGDVTSHRSLIDPVNLLEWNSDGCCVLLDLSAFLAVTALISKHAISEDDHVIISYGERSPHTSHPREAEFRQVT